MSERRPTPLNGRYVESLLARLLPACCDAPRGAVVVEGPLATRHYSLIFRATLGDSAIPLAVKCFIDPETGAADPDSARRQFAALERVYREMSGEPEYRVPRPYLLDEADALFVSEWVCGRTMTEVLLSLHTSPARVVQLLEGAGCWLRRFHDAHRLPRGPLDLDGVLPGLAEIDCSPLRAYASVRAGVEVLRRHAGHAATLELERSWLHGDFKMDNLIVSGKTIVGIDMHLRHENAGVHDLAAFANHLELTVLHPLGLRWLPWRARLARGLVRSYDDYYLSEGQIPLLWVALYLLLGDWREFTGREKETLRHRYQRACFDATVVRRTAQLVHAVARQA